MFMVSSPTSAFAEQALAEVTCAKDDGTEQTFSIGWDNSNSFFDGKGDIPHLFCEGGFAQSYNLYVRDNLLLDSPLRWYNGVVPILEPTPEVVVPTPVPSETVEPEPVPSVVPSLDPEPTPIPEPTQSESPSPEPTVEPSPTPVVTPSVTPIAEPTPSPSEETVVPVPVEPTPTPEVEPTPSPVPTIEELVPEITPEPQPTMAVPAPVSPVEEFLAEVDIQLPTYLENVPGVVQIAKAAEAIMAIGSDMTPEEREESQGVVIAAVIVSQLTQVRKLK